ncbi:hypothetical protein EXIGLDRAFT_830001 [Exidia glandulosa HHB12029]|uniref:Mid2 domain-containing protein n=1 Tax=Exidia glandulosa HHB12029 TaxID=1314781 RepID=A0A165P217_EXIGL|nr:hypothetical protein EXIGLDRAFT_830001 [Exidia glandulosa HHB12029]
MRCASLATLLGGATTAHALWYAVASGTQGYAFLPATQHAIVGDAIHFEIPNSTLADPPISVVQSKSLAEPCTPMPGGLHSDTQNPPKLDINVYSATVPVYFHAEPYCGQGMVFILNPIEDGDYDTFVKNALATAPTESGDAAPTSDSPSASPRPSSSSSRPESASTPSRTEGHSGDASVSSSSGTSVPATNSTHGGSTSTSIDTSDASHTDELGATPAPTAHVGSVGTLIAAIACSIAGTLCLSAIFVFAMRKCRRKARPGPYGEIDPEPLADGGEGINPPARHAYTGSRVLTASTRTTPAASSTSCSSMAERQLGAVQEMLQRGVSGTAVLEALRMQGGAEAEAPPRYM